MKKILIFAVVLALLVPAAAFAETQFSLGGYIKLDSYWDTTTNGAYMNSPVPRNNDPSGHHGNFRMTAMGSRFNFTIKGPDVLGAKLTGFLEMDFEESSSENVSSNSNAYSPRLRHAMFRLNWPGDTELLFGQYWSLLSDWTPEVAEDGPFLAVGDPSGYRIPQIRFTQGFDVGGGRLALAGMVADPTAILGTSTTPYNAAYNSGNAAESPQLEGQIKYQADLWGKAAYYGHPMGFTAEVTGAWQRNVSRFVTNTSVTPGGAAPFLTNYQGAGAFFGYANTYLQPWEIQGSLFIPIIPTHTDNLAGTMHLIVVPFIGQDLYAFGLYGDETNVFKLNYVGIAKQNVVDQEALRQYGAYGELQYYFTNQWYANAAYGFTKYETDTGWEYFYNSPYAQTKDQQEVDATLWWRPIAALKFGVQYSYVHTDYLTNAYYNSSGAIAQLPTAGYGSPAKQGDEHRVEFVGYFYF